MTAQQARQKTKEKASKYLDEIGVSIAIITTPGYVCIWKCDNTTGKRCCEMYSYFRIPWWSSRKKLA